MDNVPRRDQTVWLVDGELREWKGAMEAVVSPVLDPATKKPTVVGSYPLQTEKEAMEALDAASRAWGQGTGEWPSMSVAARIGCMERFLAGMVGRRAEVVNLLMWEIAKSRPDSEKEFDRTVQYMKDTIASLKTTDRDGSRFQQVEGVVAQIRRQPLGVVLCLGPSNYPLNELYTTLLPAVIMGNTVVFKPPKLGVLLHGPLLDVFAQCFPRGVVNSVFGRGANVVTPIMKTGRIDVLAMIGTSVGADLIRGHHPKPHRLRCALGLEAKNIAIVTANADLDTVVRECVTGSLSYNGQRCTAIKLVAVERAVLDAFLAKFCAAVDALKVGLPWEPGVQITPLPEPGKVAFLENMVADAVGKGARVVNKRAGALDATTYFPAVVCPVTPEMKLFEEEQFGPLVPVAVFDQLEQPLAWVRDSPYGQQASVFSNDSGEVSRLVDGLTHSVCRININTLCQRGPDALPFTGRKDSAECTLSVFDALRVFSIRCVVAAKDTQANHNLLGAIVRERSSKFLSTEWIF